MDACYEGRRIVMIPECELRLLLPRMISQRADLRAQAGTLRSHLEGLMMGWEPHNTEDCQLRRRTDQLEILMIVVDREARMSQAICHAVQRIMILNPLGVIYGPFP